MNTPLKSVELTDVEDGYSVLVSLDESTLQECLHNARYFEYTSPMIDIFPTAFPQHDMVSWFVDSRNVRRGIIHTVVGANPRAEFIRQLRTLKWFVYPSVFSYKRKCVKDYLTSAQCNKDIVLCLSLAENDTELPKN